MLKITCTLFSKNFRKCHFFGVLTHCVEGLPEGKAFTIFFGDALPGARLQAARRKLVSDNYIKEF